MTTEYTTEMLNDVKIDVEHFDERLADVTIHVNILNRWHSYTEWCLLETYELETVDTQVSTDNSEGYDALCDFLEEHFDDRFPCDFFCDVEARVNDLLKGYAIEEASELFDESLERAGISSAMLLEKLGVTRQTVANWRKSGKYPEWLTYAIDGIELELKSD